MDLLNLLKDAQKNNECIGLYMDKDMPNSFSTGFVKNCNSDYVLLSSIDRFGAPNGFEMISVSDIYKIEYGTKYIQKLLAISKIGFEFDKDFEFNLDSEKDILISSLKLIQKRGVFCSIRIAEGEEGGLYVGRIKSLQDQIIILEEFDEFGDQTGTVAICINDIQSIDINQKSEALIQALSKAE